MQNKIETWVEIKGFEGLYLIGDCGNVKSLRNNIILKPHLARGYPMVILSKGGVQFARKNHRLVAEHFIPNPNKLAQVNHIDGCKSNNRFDNLEWCSNDDNMQHAKRNGLLRNLCGTDHPNSKITPVLASEIREMSKTMTGAAIAQKLNLGIASISRIINNKAWIMPNQPTSHGHKFGFWEVPLSELDAKTGLKL